MVKAKAVKLPVQVIFDLVVENCRKVKGFEATAAELSLIRKGFQGCFNVAETATRKNPLPWAGAVRADGSIDEKAAFQSLQSAFCRLLHYHSGKSSAYLGTIINAHDNLSLCAEFFGIVPHAKGGPDWWQLPEGSPERDEARRLRDENRAAGKRFADHCDTFCQVLIYLQTAGKSSSAAGDQWRRALGVA